MHTNHEPTIDREAPVVGSSEIVIEAPPDTVWDVLAAIDDWPSWNPDVKESSLQGPLSAGTQFRWKAGPGTISSTLQYVERPRLIAWTGRTFGVNAVHVWRLEPKDGATQVRTEETFDGLVVRLLRGRLQKQLDDGLAGGLRHLKAEAERRARG
ncbi:MAG: SRPBCC family protein [Gaiellaceae bacterium]